MAVCWGCRYYAVELARRQGTLQEDNSGNCIQWFSTSSCRRKWEVLGLFHVHLAFIPTLQQFHQHRLSAERLPAIQSQHKPISQ